MGEVMFFRGPGASDASAVRLGDVALASLSALQEAWAAKPADLILAIGAGSAAAVARAMRTAATGQTVGAVVESRSARTLGRRAIGIGMAEAIAMATGLVATTRTQRIARRAGYRAEMRVLDALSDVELADFEDPAFQDKLQKAMNAARAQDHLTSETLAMIPLTESLIAGVVLLARRDPVLLALAAVGTVPQLLVLRQIPHRRGPGGTGREYREFGTTRSLLTRPATRHELILFDAVSMVRARHDVTAEKVAAAQAADFMRHGPRQLLTRAASAAASAPVLARTALGYWRGASSAAEASTSGIATNRLAASVQHLYDGTRALRGSAAHVAPFRDFLADAPSARTGGRATPAPFTTITFEHVAFAYRGSARLVLEDVNLELHRGQSVALVGENGSGKTTLAKLLCGLYQPTSGRILWDGIDATHLDPRSHRAQLSAVFQDFVRYLPFTAAENIAVGHPPLLGDRDRIVEAAVRAGADSFLRALPKGYDTVLSRSFDGVDLSTGQWQRIALARAFLRDAQVVVLDEPTAALDPRAERELFDTVVELCRSRTALLISHRLSSVRSADTIHVLDQGRIIESGPHEDLITHKGLYHELFTLQANAYR